MRWFALMPFFGSAVCVAAAAFAPACQPGAADAEPCGQLPDVTACPVGRGGTCLDPECSALYDCIDGDWQLHETCDNNTGGGGSGGTGQGGAGGACLDANLDTEGQASLCPALQEPDCPVEIGNVCQPCLTGCTDFLFCQDGNPPGWVALAYCDPDGNLIVTPP